MSRKTKPAYEADHGMTSRELEKSVQEFISNRDPGDETADAYDDWHEGPITRADFAGELRIAHERFEQLAEQGIHHTQVRAFTPAEAEVKSRLERLDEEAVNDEEGPSPADAYSGPQTRDVIDPRDVVKLLKQNRDEIVHIAAVVMDNEGNTHVLANDQPLVIKAFLAHALQANLMALSLGGR